jgi:DegV family protein with EDD domain
MSNIEIITDSTCDIPEKLIQQYHITVLPHTVIWGNHEYHDRVDLQPEEFYRKLTTEKTLPTSAQASVMEFASAFRNIQAGGAKEIITITVSSAMSGAFQSAINAAKQVDIPVHVVDSKGPTMTLGWQVLAAARMRDAGASVQSILDKVDAVRKSMVQYVMLDTLEFLRRGGRIGNATNLISSILQIKPLVHINHETGLVETGELARTYNRAKDMLFEKFFSKLDLNKTLHVAVLHGNALEEAEKLADLIRREINPAELLINITGPVLGINTGPRALALCGYTE